ncbi:MAG: S8 family serine peptidase, partial [bacterium]|nr:S8 family serine peptidase [bacterium]
PADNTYNYLRGTSMAAPHVAGLTTLVWARFPTASYREVILAIFDGGASQGNLASITCTGVRANVPGALRALEATLNQ